MGDGFSDRQREKEREGERVKDREEEIIHEAREKSGCVSLPLWWRTLP